MNQNDINQAFTDKVTELLAQGYQINPATMGGSQGEIAHIDLRRGTEVLRVLLESKSGFGRDSDYLWLAVGRCTEELRRVSFESHSTIWNERLEILFEIKFARITPSFFTDMETGRHITEKRFDRWKNRKASNRLQLGDAYKVPALKYIRRQPRMKTCRLDEIESVTRMNRTEWGKTLPDLYGYEIKARGKTFQILAPRKSRKD